MFYQFPTINHIDEVLPHIEGHTEFFVSKKDGYTVVDYSFSSSETFGSFIDGELDHSSKIRRECRGLKFDHTGKTLARCFHKFFNLSEKEETQIGKFSWDNSIVLEKLDGSSIQATLLNNQLTFMTMMGVTDIAKQAMEFAQKDNKIPSFCRLLINEGYTPIFDWCSRQNQVVIDYPEPRLVLTALRHTVHGYYVDYETMVKKAKVFGVEYIKTGAARLEGEDSHHYIERIYGMTGIEGFVIRFTNGHMIKIKCDEYLRKHRAKEGVTREKDLIGLIVNKELDDVKPSLTEADLAKVNKFEECFWAGTKSFIEELTRKYQAGKSIAGEDKRLFAIEFVNKQEPMLKPLLFDMWKSNDAKTTVLEFIKDNINTQTDVDKIRPVFGVDWKDI